MQFEHQVQDIVIQLEDIWKTYQTGEVSLTALKGIDLTIRRGEFAAIMGPSGSGKSTLMNVIGCLDQKDQGNYLLNGRSISELSATNSQKYAMKKLASFFNHLTYYQNSILEKM
jgi:putative ABC transport system ATP-binding protein